MNVSPPSHAGNMNVPAMERRGAGRRGGSSSSSRRTVRRASLSLRDLLIGGGGGDDARNTDPAASRGDNSGNTNNNSSSSFGGRIKMRLLKPQKSALLKLLVSSAGSGLSLGKSNKSKKNKGPVAQFDDEDDGECSPETATEGGGGRGSVGSRGSASKSKSKSPSFKSNLNKQPKTKQKKPKTGMKLLKRGRGGFSTTNNKADKTLAELMEKKAWRKVRSKLMTDEGRAAVVASLLTSSGGGDDDDGDDGVGADASVPNTTRTDVYTSSLSDPRLTSPVHQNSLNTKHATNEPKSTSNLLHLAVLHRAPLSILDVLLDICPSLSVEHDFFRRRTALHLAASPEARLAISRNYESQALTLDVLFESNPGAVWARDDRGRVPLHVACMAAADDDLHDNVEEEHEDDDDTNDPSMDYLNATFLAMFRRTLDHDAVSVLVQWGPSALLLEDDVGLIPVEYALRASAGSGGASSEDDERLLDRLLGLGEQEWERRGRRSNTGKVKDEDDDDNAVDAEYDAWTARRTPRFIEALGAFLRRRDRQEESQEREQETEDEMLARRQERAVAMFLGAGSHMSEDTGARRMARRRASNKEQGRERQRQEARDSQQAPAVPEVVEIDLHRSDESLEDELELEFFEEEWGAPDNSGSLVNE